MNQSDRSSQRQGRRRRRGARPPGSRQAPPIPVTPEGMPAAVPDAPPASPAVFTAEESLARYPWLPRRVIAGSVWRGPGHIKVKVDAAGHATPWPPPPPIG